MTTTLTARCPEDLIALVPVVLGFEPADSIVMLTLGAQHTFHARVDLPLEHAYVPDVLEMLLAPAVRHRAEAAVFLVYTDDERLARAVVRRLTGRGPAALPRLVEALRVDAGRWYPMLRDRRGLGTTGVPYDVSSHPFVAQAVLDGRVLHQSRDDLAATLGPDPAAVAQVEASRTGLLAPGSWVGELLDTAVTADEPLGAADAARLLESIAVPDVRDAAWVRVRRATADEDVRFWTAMVRRAPEDLVAHAAAVLGLVAWVAGHGALAWCAVDRAEAAHPGHSLAGLVADMLIGAVPPDSWEEASRQLRSVS